VHGNEPSGFLKCLEVLSSCTIGGFSGRAQLREVSEIFRDCSHWFVQNMNEGP
jgi:hypothetical protein